LQLQELSMSAVASTYILLLHRNNISSCTLPLLHLPFLTCTPWNWNKKGTLFPVCGLRLKHDPQKKRKPQPSVAKFLIPTPRKSQSSLTWSNERRRQRSLGAKNLTFSCSLVLKPEAESNSTAIPQWYYSESERSRWLCRHLHILARARGNIILA
jgi:hypothetical protein